MTLGTLIKSYVILGENLFRAKQSDLSIPRTYEPICQKKHGIVLYSFTYHCIFIHQHACISSSKKLIPFFPPHQFHPKSLTPLQHSSSRSSKDDWSRTRKCQSKGRTQWHQRRCEPNERDAISFNCQAWSSSSDCYFRYLRSFLLTLTCKNRTFYMVIIWATSQLCMSSKGNSWCCTINSWLCHRMSTQEPYHTSRTIIRYTILLNRQLEMMIWEMKKSGAWKRAIRSLRRDCEPWKGKSLGSATK